jgi:hypothetical protein
LIDRQNSFARAIREKGTFFEFKCRLAIFADNRDKVKQAASYGGLVTGPIYALWYPWLDRQCVAWKVGRRFASAWAEPVVKVAADEFIMDPPTIAMFFAYMEFCQNNMVFDYERTRQKIVRELPVAWVASLMAWPAVLLATFRWIPVYAQPAVVNLCAIVWDGFLSHRNALANRKSQQPSNTPLPRRSTATHCRLRAAQATTTRRNTSPCREDEKQSFRDDSKGNIHQSPNRA